MKKKIILAMTSDMKFYECFKENLEKNNFDTTIIVNDYKYKSLKEKLISFYQKIFLKNKNAKKEIIQKSNINSNLKVLNSLGTQDFSLVIRPDLFDLLVIKKIIEKSKSAYAYQWDGLNRFPEVRKYIPFFKKFYVFDKIDASENTFAINNFYFDCYEDLINNKEFENDVFFIGTYDSRYEKLIQICEKLNNLGLKLNIQLASRARKTFKKHNYLTHFQETNTYLYNLQNLSKSKIILDLHHDNLHTGLSFRNFEAIGYHKKLITTNPEVKKYDFYDSKRIFVYDVNSTQKELQNFINEPFVPYPEDIRKKYSFTNWIHQILEIENEK